MGGYCAKLGIWWQIRWSNLGGNIVHHINTKIIGIQVLELALIILNYLAIAFTFYTQILDYSTNRNSTLAATIPLRMPGTKVFQSQRTDSPAHQYSSIYDEYLQCGNGFRTYRKGA